MDIIQEIKAFVESECKKPTSKYGYGPFLFHFVPMVNHAETLAEELGADKEIVLLAAWLHDIGSIIYGREDHHKTGAVIAEEKLASFGYPKDRIERIKRCILNHRGSQHNQIDNWALEEQIVAEADAVSNFDNIAGIFQAALVYENKSQDEAKESVRQKFQNKWNQLQLENSKRIAKPKFDAAMLLLEDNSD